MSSTAEVIHNIHRMPTHVLCFGQHSWLHSGDRIHTYTPMKRLLSVSDLGINTVNNINLGNGAHWRGCALAVWGRTCARVFMCNEVGVICQDWLDSGKTVHIKVVK